MNKQAERHTEQADDKTDRQAGAQTYRQTDRHMKEERSRQIDR